MGTLTSYTTAVQRLIHDTSNKFWDAQTVTDAINEASSRSALDGRGLRSLVSTLPPFTVTNATWLANVATYTIGAHTIQVGVTFSVVGMTPSGYNVTNVTVTAVTATTVSGALASNPGAFSSGGTLTAQLSTIASQEVYSFPTVLAGGANQVVTDILNVSILQGSVRYAMRYLAWTEFNANLRAWQNYNSLPLFWSVYGQGQFYLGPVPDQAYVMEVDCCYQPFTMVSGSDNDGLNYPYTQPVQYYAAYILQLQKQRYQEAQAMLSLYQQRLMELYEQTNARRIRNPYY